MTPDLQRRLMRALDWAATALYAAAHELGPDNPNRDLVIACRARAEECRRLETEVASSPTHETQH